jgi:hypothetical protein
MSHIILSCLIAFLAQAAPETSRPVVGAIRWDGWHGDASSVGLTVEKTLSPEHWHYRLPFFGRVTGENQVEARGNTQEIVDREIEYAHAAGLDYWAFVTYPEDDALSYGLKYYLSSEKKELIHFCLNLQGGWESGGGMEAWPDKVKRYVNYFQEPTYQTVLNGRPLVFLYSVEGLVGEGVSRPGRPHALLLMCCVWRRWPQTFQRRTLWHRAGIRPRSRNRPKSWD